MRTFIRRSRPAFRRGYVQFISVVLAGAVLGFSTGSTTAAPTSGSGLKPISQAALQGLIDVTARELLVPGAVVLLRTPQGDFTAATGTTQLNSKNPPRADTHFRIASNTKTMTAAVIMQLAQESKLGFNDPVSKYVPGVPNSDNITIAQLLEMRSGLYNYTNDPIISATIDTDPAKVWTPAELLAIAFAHPPNFPPGAKYEYNNTNYALLGLVVEKVDGEPLAQAMQDRLFGPLGLQQTLLPASTVNTLPEPYSHGYLYGSSSVALVGEPPYSPEVQAAARAGTLLPKDYTGVNHSIVAAAWVSFPPPTISPPGSRHWLRAACSTPPTNAAGSTASSLRTRASPRAKSTGTASPNLAGDRTRFIFTAARPPATTQKSATTRPTT
jgi:D-alanyl-D-alanine carboxypeptidase